MPDFLRPPIGHPHYMPAEQVAVIESNLDEDDDPMTTTAASEQYKALREKIVAARKQMEETAKGLFMEMATGLFEANPTLMSFRWEQYTPYFNDGDVCTFRCNGDYPTVSMLVDGEIYGYDANRGELEVGGNEVRTAEDYLRTFKSLGPLVTQIMVNGKTVIFDPKTQTVTVDGVKAKTYDEYRNVFKGLEKIVGGFMKNFEDEDMQVMFGDHMRVTVHRDGNVETEEYQHD